MTLTILDPRSGNKVTICVEDVPAVRQASQARVVMRAQLDEAKPS
jgi:hypothetical protein